MPLAQTEKKKRAKENLNQKNVHTRRVNSFQHRNAINQKQIVSKRHCDRKYFIKKNRIKLRVLMNRVVFVVVAVVVVFLLLYALIILSERHSKMPKPVCFLLQPFVGHFLTDYRPVCAHTPISIRKMSHDKIFRQFRLNFGRYLNMHAVKNQFQRLNLPPKTVDNTTQLWGK